MPKAAVFLPAMMCSFRDQPQPDEPGRSVRLLTLGARGGPFRRKSSAGCFSFTGVLQRTGSGLELEHSDGRTSMNREPPAAVSWGGRWNCGIERRRSRYGSRRDRARAVGHQTGGRELFAAQLRSRQGDRNDQDPEDSVDQHQGRSPEAEDRCPAEVTAGAKEFRPPG